MKMFFYGKSLTRIFGIQMAFVQIALQPQPYPMHLGKGRSVAKQFTEIDISVQELLGFETFAYFLMVSDSVSENLVSEKKVSIAVWNIWSRKKVSISVSENIVSERVSLSVLENLFSKKSLGIGFGKFGLEKKSWFRKIWSRKRKN